MFHLVTIVVFVSMLCSICSKSTNSHNPAERTMQILRNQYYRVYIWNKAKIATASYKTFEFKRRFIETKKKIKDRTNKIYDTVLLKYYDSQMIYYSLPNETREVIEQLINLHF